MENNYLGQFETFGKAAVDAAKELETINAKLVEQLTAKNLDLFNSAIEINNKFMSLFGQTKGVQDLLTGQMKLGGEYNGKVITTIKEAAEIMVESKDDYQSWFKGGLETVTATAEAIVPTEKTSTKKAA